MSVLAAARPHRRKINLRAQVRRALLAAGEACWVYAVVLTLGGPLHFQRLVSPLGIFFVYWIALLVGRYLPTLNLHWRALQALNLLIAIFAILAAVRFDLLRDSPWFDLAWLPSYLAGLAGIFERFTGDQVSTLVLLYAYVRGLGYAERPLTLWFVGYQFRLGVVILFLSALVAGFFGVDFRVWLFVYFVLSLLAISLARIEESGREMPLGSRWVLILISSTLLVALLAFGTSRVFTVAVAQAFFEMLSPLWLVAQALLIIVLIPLTFVAQVLAFLLGPLLQAIGDLMGQLHLPNIIGMWQPAGTAKPTDQLAPFFPALRLVGLILLVFAFATLIARGMQRRMRRSEEEAFALESVDERDIARDEKLKPARRAASRRRDVQAENIRRIYAALLALASERGLPRREAETPYEFLPRLVGRFPSAKTDLSALTEAYVAVHYAQTPTTDAQVRRMRALWQRLRGELAKGGIHRPS